VRPGAAGAGEVGPALLHEGEGPLDGVLGAEHGPADLKVHAIARLYFQGVIDHIQASWVKIGPKLAQVLLLAGADDFGGTLMEEHIAKAAGGTERECLQPEMFVALIQELGLTPVQRTTLYKPIKVYEEAA
jgi:2-iminoacetate synthase ThiH